MRIVLTITGILVLAVLIATWIVVAPLPGIPNTGTQTATVLSPFVYHFSVNGTLHETGTMSDASSPYWWLNSGGKLILQDGRGQTVQGDLPLLDPWRILYAASNPSDTDQGRHPQNLFRLISRSTWNNVRLDASFYVERDNLSSSINRNESNGLLLMSRYARDGQTLYYAGVRVDGTAVIKKKYKGSYYTMAQKAVFSGSYNAATSPNLIPHHEWIQLRSETETQSDGSVVVRLFMKRANDASWLKLLDASDNGQYGGTPPITGSAYVGVRTDFMDVQFDDVGATAL